jgi:PadR family transcriptional regulator, regulatory protein PadR
MGQDTPQLLPGTLYMLILRTLAAGPLHGYALLGWLKAEWGTSETNRKARFYHLTDDGRKQLATEAGEFNRLVDAIQLVMKTV